LAGGDPFLDFRDVLMRLRTAFVEVSGLDRRSEGGIGKRLGVLSGANESQAGGGRARGFPHYGQCSTTTRGRATSDVSAGVVRFGWGRIGKIRAANSRDTSIRPAAIVVLRRIELVEEETSPPTNCGNFY